MSPADKAGLFAQLAATLGLRDSGESPAAVDPSSVSELVGIQLCLQLVQQFSADKSVAMGLPFEFHRQCGDSFQAGGLKDLFALCTRFLARTMPAVAAASGASATPLGSGDPSAVIPSTVVELLGGVLDAMGEILNWDFKPARPNQRLALLRAATVALTPTTLAPGRTWHDVLVASGLPAAMFEVYAPIKYFHSTDIPLRARHIITQVCAAPPPRVWHPCSVHAELRAVLCCVSQLCSLADSTFQDVTEQVGVAQQLVRGLLALSRSSLAATSYSLEKIVQSFSDDSARIAAAAGSETLDLCRVCASCVPLSPAFSWTPGTRAPCTPVPAPLRRHCIVLD